MEAIQPLVMLGPPAVEPLIAVLKDPAAGVRDNAATALGDLKDPRAVEPLIAVLEDTDPRSRFIAAHALGEIGDSRAVEPLIAALNDPNDEVRWNAVYALGEVDDPRAVRVLLQALGERNMPVILGAHLFFMRRLDPASPDVPLVNVLIEALQVGDYEMGMAVADDFLNDGNSMLQQAAEAWGRKLGLSIATDTGGEHRKMLLPQ
jgi:HEAT repeat protein